MVKFLALIPLVAGAWLITAWVLMINAGIVHHEWISALPPIGFTTAAVISGVSMLGVVVRLFVAGAIQAVAK